MKITKKTLQRLIKEELDNMLDEEIPDPTGSATPIARLAQRVELLERGLRAAFDQIKRVESAIKPSAWQG